MTISISDTTLEKFTTFGDLLRFLRRRMGITQTELAIAVSYSHTQISRLEQNLRLPDISTIEARFLTALGLEEEPKAVARLLELAANARRDDAPAPGLCPYKGLNYFDESDADLFVGREVLTAKLVERVLSLVSLNQEPRFLAVVGASGSGKSSLVRAGLVYALRWHKASTDWHIHVFTPTAHPLESLATTLTREIYSVSEITTLMDDLAREPRSLYIYAKHKLELEINTRILLVIDQFEELFALCRSEDERASFIENLLTASSEPEGRVIIVITLRADFYAQCANYVHLREALAKNQEYIGAMNNDEIRRSIEEPAEHGRWEFEPGLVGLILHDIGHEPGALPLLSHALFETWQRRRGRVMTLGGYASSGGVRGAIAETAEAVFIDQFTDEQRSIARKIFLRLTEMGDETTAADTRRRATFNELILKPENAKTTRDVLKALADARLIVTTEDSAEVAHEALIREWPTLRGWLEENREDLRLHRKMTEAAQEWNALNRSPDLLYRGARLAQTREWAATHKEEMNALEHEFLSASIEASEREAAERESQRQRELEAARKLAETEKARAEEQMRSANRLRSRNRLIAGAGVIALLLAILAALFGVQSSQHATRAETNFGVAQANAATAEAERQRAESEKRLAISRELAIAAVNNLEIDPELSILLALHALSVAHTDEAENALHRGVQASRVQFSIPGFYYSLDYSPDGRRLALGRSDGMVIVFDTSDGQELLSIVAHADAIWSLVHSPDGARIATASDDYTAKVFDAASGQELLTLSGHSDFVSGIAYSPNGAFIATASFDTTVKVWDAETGQELFTLSDHTAPVQSAIYSPDGKWLITSSDDNTVKIRDAETGRVLFTPQEDRAWATIYSSDGTRYATVSTNWDLLRISDAASGQELFALRLDGPSVFDFNADGKRLVTASQSGILKIWDAATGDELLTIFNPRGNINVDFSPDGKHVAASNRDGRVRVFDISPEGSREWLTLASHGGWVRRVVYSPDGSRLATAGVDGTAKVFDAATGLELLTLSGHTDFVFGIAYSPDGSRLATASHDKTVRVWDAETGQELLTLSKAGHGDGIVGGLFPGVLDVAFSPDGRRLASAGADGTAIVWDAITGKELLTLSNHGVGLTTLAFSPDGTRLVTTSDTDPTLDPPETAEEDATATMWDLNTRQEIFSVIEPVRIWGLAFDRDGERFATGAFDGVLRLWDAATGHKLLELPGHAATIVDIRFSKDGQTVATGSQDGTAKVWDAASGKELVTLTSHTSAVSGVAFSPDGTRLATASRDGTMRVHALRLEDLIVLARSRVTRSLTPEECQKYLHIAQCPSEP